MNLKILPKFQWYRRIKALFTYQSVVSNRLDANTAEIFMLRQNVDRLLNEIQLRGCPACILLYQFSPKDTGQSKVK